MAARIRTLNFLPEVFRTPTNAQFLGATLDQVVAQPNTMRIQGYVGSKFGYGINAKDNYVVEPTKTRTDYQLDPGVVFTKTNTATATDFITYPGIIDALKLNGGVTNNNDRLFNSQFYSWDPFVDLDKLINFNQYYWLPQGAPAVTIATDIVYNAQDYTVVDDPNAYIISSNINPNGSANPTLTLIRGGTYSFTVSQDSPFWIQGQPGVTGYDPNQPNLLTRDVLGVSNNGAENGVVEFTVPYKNAQDEYNFPGDNRVDVVSSAPFDSIEGQLLSNVVDIDGVTALEGLTVMFYNTGVVNEQGFVGQYYDTTLYDEDGGAPYTYPGSSINDNNFGGGYYTEVSATFYTITYVGDPTNPVIKLVPASGIPTNEKITANYGTQWKARNFYRNVQGTINVVPYLSSLLDTLYYQDGTIPNKVGLIRLINSNITNQINVLEILGQSTYTSPNGVVFTNGLKVTFDGDIFPTSYKTGEYYVQGVGTAIELINTQDLIVPEPFTEGTYNPWDILPYDIGNYDVTLYIPVQQDYITIARNSIDRNPWSRSNRWFHIDVINATATYNNDPSIATTYATQDNKAKRPVIEFYPNLKLFDNCIVGKQPVDFFDVRTTDAFTQVAGQQMYYPDVEVYTTASATIASTPTVPTNATALVVGNTYRITSLGSTNWNTVAGTSGLTYSVGDEIEVSVVGTGTGTALELVTSTTISISASAVSEGAFQVGQYVTDTAGVLPRNSQIADITGTTTLTINVEWSTPTSFTGVSNTSLIANDIANDNYALYDGARIIFSVDDNADVRNKIYVVRFSNISGSTPVITLTEADDGLVLQNQGTVAYKGYYNQGKNFYYYFNNDPAVLENQWQQAQQKTTVNQAPLFDVFDADGISFGDKEIYTGSSFKGNKLFSYGIGSGINDVVLGFPLRYSSVNNVGDISFDVPINSATFDYVRGATPITQQVNTGYVHNYSDLDTRTRALGWQTAVAESRQYQIFSFNYVANSGVTTYTCDIAAATDTVWPNIQVYVNNVLQDTDTYTYTINPTTTVVNFTVPNTLVDTVVEITLLSDQVSSTAYYQIPNNLQNNPFNADITTANVGDIRGQYQSIFYNNPNTTGNVFGANNYRDLGNLVPWGNRIIQNSASLVLPATFLRKPGVNLYDSLQYNSNQYISFKTLLIDTVNQTEYNVYLSPATMLDDALDQITISKVDSAPFFWSDMLPSKSPYASNSYTFANSLDVSRYPLSRIYNFSTANYYGVLVYLTRTVSGFTSTTQLVSGVDYTISSTSPSLTVETDLLPGDIITVNEYYQTYGSYVPNTPTKLGLYPSFIPEVVLDENYTNPTYFIRGHDGSFTKLYGDYIDGNLVDFRDKVLLEFETRIYNNLKLSNIIPVRDYDVVPGFFRTTDYSYNEFLSIYSQFFLNWVGQNRVEYKQQVGYTPVNQFSYNYSQSGNKINNAQIQQGYWRGIYQYFYDTSQPDVAPWEMIGFTSQPTWWTGRYGPAPYTSDNLVLWGDLAAGINWNNGDPVVVTQCVRPQLLQVLPVDSEGNLVSPFDAIVGNYDGRSFRSDWKVGDVAPTEFAYRRSSSWPFDLMKILALTKPANFYNLGVDVDNYKYNEEFNQFLVNDRSHLVISDVEIYGSGTAKTSYINWIVDYEKQVGIDSTQTTTDLLDNLDVRLIYRVAGFTDKALVNFYVEKGSPNSNNASLLIPTESLDVLLYDNIPFNKIIYSGIIVQNAGSGWKVFGNSQTKAYFTVSKPKINGNYNLVTVEGESVQVAKDYFENTEILVPYGTEFVSKQDLAQFIGSYGNYLTTQGVLFDQIESGLDINWNQMVAEYLYWTQSGWGQGSLINLNPAANLITIQKDSCVVQPLTLQRQNFILNQNLYPIQAVDLAVVRDDTLFSAKPLNQGDTVAYGQFNISNFEHGVVFNNVTLFNDVIYNLITGLRQNRITTRGTKTADWNGTIDAQGFILNQDNIQEWNNITKYTKGAIVKYKNKFWVSLKVLEPSMTFDSRYWKETDYNEIQKGLLPNPSTRSYESTLYYDTDTPNLSKDADLLSWSLIGYRPRDYMALADLTDITQVNVYQNLIKEKGTRIATENFKGITLPQGGIDYDVYENWAIKTGEFGGVLDNNFIDFRLNQNELTGNPSIVGLTTGTYTDGVQQEVPLYSVFNYGRPITNPNVLPTLPANTPNKLYPDAGYVNFNDITTYGYYYNDLNLAQTPLSQLYVGQYVWVADYNGTWQVYTPISNGNIIQVLNNLNGTVTLEFAEPHGLTKYQTIAIINFNDAVNGYRIVQSVVDNYRVTIALALVSTITRLTSTNSIVMKFQSQRISQPSDIVNLPLLNTEFVKNKVWVDTGTDGDWAVYRKSINYNLDLELLKTNSESFGSAVATTSALGYLVSDAELGVAYRYTYNPVFNRYDLSQTIFSDTATAGSFVVGKDYQIISLGTTNNTEWNTIAGTSGVAYNAGSRFTCANAGTSSLTAGTAGLFSNSFGASIGYAGSTFAISQPTGTLLVDRKVKIYDLVTNNTVNELQVLQTIQAPTGVTNWGTKTEFSGDSNWLFISAYEQNAFYVYRKSQVTGLYEYSTTITLGNLTTGDNFSFSLATNYYGNTIVVGAPGVDTGIVNNTGTSYIFERVMQNFESQFTSQQFVPQTFSLAFTPGTRTFTGTTITSNAITLNSVAGLTVDMPVIFTGSVFGGLAVDQVYYIKSIVSSTITLSLTIGGSTLSLTNSSGSMTMVAQSEPLYVSVNGTLIDTNNYAVAGSTLSVYQSLNAGDILTVSGATFVLIQQFFATDTITIGEQYGYSADLDTYGNELLIGAPFQINSQNKEGTIYRYTDGGGSYGIITGAIDCQVTVPATILLNGYAVAIPAGNASVVAAAIEAANVTNITATAIDNKLVISLINIDLASINDKLDIVTLNGNALYELGISKYTLTQTITDPHPAGRTQFGTVIKFNDNGSFVASAPVAPRYEATTFDSTDDDNYNNDTLFDNNTTRFVDTLVNAGAVYMFDYAENYNENLLNVGQYVYAQSVNALNINYGAQPYYGTAIDFNDNIVVVGTPAFRPGYENGQVIIYTNSSGQADWSVYRQPETVVDVNGIKNAQLYSASTNNTLINLDYIDPLQGKILGVVAENLDIISNADPASYNSPNTTVSGSAVWGTKQLGKLWFNTSTTKFVNYHQNDEVVYNSKWWGRVFPGSQVTIYSWITSNVVPAEYTGPGTPLNLTDYAVEYVLNSTGAIVPVYFFWARNTNIIFSQIGKTLSDTICESYITTPQASGIAYFAPIQSNVMGLYNTSEYVNSTDTVMHIGFATGTNEDDSHSVYSLIRANYPDDFLPGLPASTSLPPLSLYDRMLDSMSGVDESGAIVPDPYLPKPVQSGILVRPRQSFFYSRFGALKNYLTLANQELAKIPFTETQSSKFLYTTGPINPSTGLPFYETTDYWDPVNWWATGYNDNTKSAMLVESYYQLATINAQNGLIVTVNRNGAGFQETYRYDSALDTWERIGLQDGTIQFKTDLWDYESARLGWGDNFFDTTPFDTYPSEETRSITRFLNEELPSEIFAFRNQGLILLFNYIMSETIESQNYLPWLNKTSFIDVAHTIRELLPLEVFQSDNQEFLSGYINEVKPYHVVVKDFLFKYTGVDVWAGDITDFDLPAQYNTSLQQYITPELVYANPSADNQYVPSDDIWQDPAYTNWFNNYGVSITGVNGYPITTLTSYLTLNSNSMAVDNIYGFPINGVIKIYDPVDPETDLSKKAFELIAYSSVDRAYGTLNGLTRGVNETPISNHLPGQQIYIDLPAVLVLDGGRGYANPPAITAYIDTTIYPAPRREAILQPVMNLDQLLRVDVVDPGDGYVVLPQIMIEPSTIITFNSDDVDVDNNTITVENQLVQTGDLVRYYTGSDTTPINGVKDGQYYYISVLESVPTYVIALYTTYADALQDHDRVVFLGAGSGANNNLAISARASCVTSSQPIRENITTLRYDRTTYDSQVTEWTQGNFYGSFYAGAFQNTEQVASSSLSLYNENPAISSILASAQGATFEIQNIRNNEVIEWSSRTRIVTTTTGTTNVITIAPSIGGTPDEGFVGPTTGFYVGMPIKFAGAAFGDLEVDTVYYVREIVSLTQFTISATLGGSEVSLTTATTTAGLDAIIGEVTNTAVVTIQYPGILTATATQKTTNFVTIPLNPSGICGTTGFYTGLPIFFTGDVFGGVIENENYYVTTVIDDQTFTMSTTNTPTIVTVESTEVVTEIIGLTTYYYYYVTLSSIDDLEINTPIIVTGTTFGGIVAGQLYYIGSIDYSTNKVTLSTTINGGAITLTDASGSATLTSQADVVQLTTTTGTMTCNVGLPISPGQITGQAFTFYNTSGEFTNSGSGFSGTVLSTALVRGQQYQIQTLGSTDFTLVGASSNTVGVVFTASGSTAGTGTAAAYSNLITRETVATVASSDYLYLNILSGGLTNMYVNMPFKLTSAIGGLSAGTTYYVASTGTISTEVTSSNAGTEEFTCASTTGFYTGMPIMFNGGVFGGVVENTTYYVNTVVSLTKFTIVDSLSKLGGVSAKNIVEDTEYTIYTVGTTDFTSFGASSNTVGLLFTASRDGTLSDGTGTVTPVFNLTGDNGLMTLTSDDPFITVKNSPTGSTIGLTDNFDAVTTLTQFPTATPKFVISYVLGGYSVQLNQITAGSFVIGNTYTISSVGTTNFTLIGADFNTVGLTFVATGVGTGTGIASESGSGFAYNNNITIPGSLIPGGTTGVNDIVINVSALSSTGGIASTIVSGTPPGLTQQYYLKVISPTELEVYSNPNLTVPVNGNTLGAIYTGVKSTTVTGVTASNDRLTVTSSDDFELNDPVVFTGDVYSELTLGQTYYIKSKPSTTTVTISTTINGSTLNLTGTTTGLSFTMAKSGDYVYLPEPFYFNQSIVRYNNRLYQCIVSNNDTAFILGKWELLDSGDRKLNELDRIVGYYNPTVNMPGRDLTQLVTGITYPGSVYMDNAFPPADEFLLDTVLQDQPFYPATLNNVSVIWNGTTYIIASTTSEYSALITSATGSDWVLTKLSNNPVALTDIGYSGSRYVISTSNAPTPVYTSADGLVYTTGPSLTVPSNSLSSVYYGNGTWVAVGENIIGSNDTVTWYSSYSLSNPGYFTGVTYLSTGWLAIGNQTVNGVEQSIILQSTASGFFWNIVNAGVTTNITDAFLNAITSGNGLVVIVANDGRIFTTNNGAITTPERTSGTSENLVDATYGNGKFIAVGDNGTIVTSTDGTTWTVQTSGTTNNLNSVAYNDTAGEFIVVGDNNTILIADSSDVTTWTASALFIQEEPVYTVQGDTFTEGYGPEELVPGVVTDNLTMIVTTRPGTTWRVGEYGHTGFTVVSTEIAPTNISQTEYSFLNITQNPAYIAVYDITPATGLSTRLYEGYDYTIDWVNKIVTLDNPVAVNHTIGIDSYEAGNGDQLQRSNSQTVPFVTNDTTGFVEMPLNCNYSGGISTGNGLIRPSTVPLQVECTETEASTDSITCDDVSGFVLNSPITFQGGVFGGIALDTIYYVKTISYVTSKITVALGPLIDGQAGPTFAVTDATGSMQAIVVEGTGLVWSEPLVVHNGVKLVLGESTYVTQTKSSVNSIVVNTSVTIDVNDPIVFSDSIETGTFAGCGLTAHTVYYVNEIIDFNEFTVTATLGSGVEVVLTNRTGLAICVTNDYAISIADIGTTAKLVFANEYNQTNDFVTFAVFGQSEPIQYGYSVPETQLYTSQGGETQLYLTNYVGGTNPENAVVEKNGLRLTNVSDYTINGITQIIYFNESLTNGDLVAITTYNDTDRQYLSTTLGGSFSGSSSLVFNIGSTTHLPGFDEEITAGEFIIGTTYQIVDLGTTTQLQWNTIAGTSGLTYVVGDIFTCANAGTGTGIAGVGYGGGADGAPGVDLGPVTAGSFVIGDGYTISTLDDGIGGLETDFTLIGATNNTSGTYFVATGVGTGTGTASIGNVFSPGPDYITLSSGTTDEMTVGSAITFSAALGGIEASRVYYILEIINSTNFTVSTTPGGEPLILTTATGSILGFINPPTVANIVAVNNLITAPVNIGITAVSSTNNLITCSSTAGFSAGQPVMFKSSTPTVDFGNIDCNGTVYWISNPSYSVTEFTISETPGGAEFDPGNDSGSILGQVGGNPAVSITTGIDHTLQDNDIVRINGTLGSIQLNNSTYYAKVLSATQIALYFTEYNFARDVVNDPVTDVSNWISGGYVWLDKQFTLTNATATATTSGDNTITVSDTSTIEIDSPVYFSGNVFGNVVEGDRYYVKSIVGNDITISETYQGSEFVLTTDTGSMGVTMWEQENVDRIWVTVNGERVPSSALYLNPNNNLSILTQIVPGDTVIITNMIATSTPDELTYINNVNKFHIPTVYRATSLSTTWLTQPLAYTDSTIYVEDVTKITTNVVQNETVPAAVGGVYSIGLDADKRIISQVIVVNNSTPTPTTLPSSAYSVQIVDTAPILEITSGVTAGNDVTITVILGNLIYVAGEQIKFTTVDFDTNTLTGLQRGTNGTGERDYIPAYEKVYGILSTNQLPNPDYYLTWNSYVYNPTLGDPLQISDTQSANFLNAEF